MKLGDRFELIGRNDPGSRNGSGYSYVWVWRVLGIGVKAKMLVKEDVCVWVRACRKESEQSQASSERASEQAMVFATPGYWVP